jgi:hypothetical protein
VVTPTTSLAKECLADLESIARRWIRREHPIVALIFQLQVTNLSRSPTGMCRKKCDNHSKRTTLLVECILVSEVTDNIQPFSTQNATSLLSSLEGDLSSKHVLAAFRTHLVGCSHPSTRASALATNLATRLV